jgi:tetratricopeptide (TPR) repeat protein
VVSIRLFACLAADHGGAAGRVEEEEPSALVDDHRIPGVVKPVWCWRSTLRAWLAEHYTRRSRSSGSSLGPRRAKLAETFSRKAIAARPDFAAGHGQLGVDLNFQSRWSEAAREFEVAVRLNPRDAATHTGLAVAEANIGRLADARREVQEALRLDPDSEQAKRLQQALEQPPLRDGGGIHP